MKRILSVLMVLVYGSQLTISCSSPLAVDELASEAVATAVARQASRAVLNLPADTLLPTGTLEGTAAGHTPGKLDVSVDGAANYSIPLWSPVGRNGVAPSLSLQYRSSQSNGLVGVGWGLSGLSQISRCGKSLAQDQTLAPIRFDDTDRFCLDGQRLVQVGSGTGWTEYRTEVDSFSKILAHQPDTLGPTWFQVWRQDGRIMSYGTMPETTHSRIEGRRLVVEPLGTTNPQQNNNYEGRGRFAWSLSEMADRSGNRMVVYYGFSEDAADGYAYEQWPSQIRYTFGPGGSALAEAQRSVSFLYETRTDTSFSFVSGFKLETTRRLSRVEMRGPPSGLLRSYNLRYRNDSISSRSLLREIQECDGFEVCARPTVFTWELGNLVFKRREQAMADGVTPGSLLSLDVNGDGLDDLLYMAWADSKWYFRLSRATPAQDSTQAPFSDPIAAGLPSAGLNDPTAPGVFEVGDFNRDGRSDIVMLRYKEFIPGAPLPNGGHFPHRIAYTVQAYLSTGTSFVAAGEERSTSQSEPFSVLSMKLADLDGDLAPEIIVSWGADVYWAYLKFDGSTMSSWTALPQASGRRAILSGDIDGDGTVELLARPGPKDNAGVWHHGYGLTPEGQQKDFNIGQLASEYLGRVEWFADLNGDGLPDHLLSGDAGGDVIVALNTGRGYLEAGLRVLPSDFAFPSSVDGIGNRKDAGVRVVDFDGDGHQDFLLARGNASSNSTMSMLLTRGTFFEGRVPRDEAGGVLQVRANNQLLDVNGDGQADVIGAGLAGGLTLFQRVSIRADLMTHVQDGLGFQSSIGYAPLSDGRVYSSVTGTAPCSYPVLCVKGGGWVVSRVDSLASPWDDGARFDFLYAGGRRDVRGRGWLGFSQRVVKNAVTGTTTTTTFDNSTQVQSFYPNARLPVVETLEAPMGAGKVLTAERRTTRSYAVRAGSAGGEILALSESMVLDREWETPPASTGAILRQNQSTTGFDTLHGNKLWVEAVSGDGETSIWGATYDDDETQWLLGRVDRVTQTSTIPAGGFVTRTTDYDYQSGTTLLLRETVEPTVSGTEAEDVRLVTTYQRLPSGVVEKVEQSDVLGRVSSTTLRYDAEEVFPVTALNHLGHRTDYAFHPGLGVVALEQDANGLLRQRKYDGFGRLRSESAAGDDGWSFSYGRDEQGRSTLSALSMGGEELFILHDGAGREILKRVRNFDDSYSAVGVSYDGLGRPKTATVPYSVDATVAPAVRSFEYDSLGRLRKVTQPDGSTIEHTYQNLQHWTKDENGHIRYTVEDQSGRVVRSVDVLAPGNELLTRYEYGAFSTLSAVVDAHQNRVSMQYDRLGRPTSLDDPDQGHTVTRYNAFGEVREQVDAAGHSTRYEHDALGRVISEIRADGTSTFSWDTAVDANGVANALGLLGTVTNGRDPQTTQDDVSSAFVYDSYSRVRREFSQVEGQLFDLERTYDVIGRLDTVTYPAVGTSPRMKVRYGYTPANTLRHVEQVSPVSKTLWTVTGRDVSGLVSSEQFGNGVTTTRRRDAEGHLRFLESLGSQGAVQRFAYDYELNGNLRHRDDLLAKVGEEFSYDSLERLTDWVVTLNCKSARTRYEYDAIGNLTRRRTTIGEGAGASVTDVQSSFAGAAPHAVKTVGASTYGYDVKGNRRSSFDAATGVSTSIDYTSFNLPTSITRGTGTSTFVYDTAHGRVAKKHSNGDSTYYVSNLYEKRTVSGAVTHAFKIYAEGRAVAQANWTGNGVGGLATEMVYLHDDHLGTVESITDSMGTVVERRKYEPFGEARSPLNPAVAKAPSVGGPGVRLGFTEHEEDAETNFVNMRGRLYDPKTASFVSPDPYIQAPILGQSYNRYSYVFNSPLNFVDPSGFSGITLTSRGDGVAYWDGVSPSAWGSETMDIMGPESDWLGLSGGGASFTGSMIGSIASEISLSISRSFSVQVGTFRAKMDMVGGIADAATDPAFFYNVVTAVRTTYEKEGLSEAVNLFNPVHHSLTSGYMAREAYEKGDYEGYGYHSFNSGLSIVTAVTGAAGLARAASSVAAAKGAIAAAPNVPGIGPLPGAAGVRVKGRFSPAQMEALTETHGVEFSLIYRTGAGKNGGGGSYWLYSGTKGRVMVPLGSDVRWIYHTHPRGGGAWPSAADRRVLELLREAGSPQRSSQIITVGEGSMRF
ncbi:RHS repeat-associated core domain-containing protein [Myxococcus sp. XM-1-1-1]|uniref:RHS repeat-associated core domain-containing protein n=1 Tax=Myxococcus sp. XM-1-1-1 TaxID=2874602 RepID=UPI001CC19787|nr:RHS repeat-associated core domain-containing protein [Myxococcus sp. XM-1-1-1]